MGIDRGLLQAMKDHKSRVEGPHFLFSAENPRHPEKNEAKLTHKEVLEHLKGAGYDAHEVNKHYGHEEKGIVVYGTSPEHAEQLHSLAARLGQDCSIHSNGLRHEMHYHHGENAGKVVHGEGTKWHKTAPKENYTSTPGGQHHFSHNFDHSSMNESKVEIDNALEKGALKNMFAGALALGASAIGAQAHAASGDFHGYLNHLKSTPGITVKSDFHPIAPGSKHGGGQYQIDIGPYHIRGVHHTIGGDQSHTHKLTVDKNADPGAKAKHEADATSMFRHLQHVAPQLLDKSEKLAKSEKDGKIVLVHYSNKEGLTHIDPAAKKSGTDEQAKDGKHPHAFYYIDGARPAPEHYQNAAHRYKVSIDTKQHSIYDLGEDQLGIVKESTKEGQGKLDMNNVHEKIKKAGYHGFRNSTHSNHNHVVGIYHPLKVDHHEPNK